ncbi:MAG: ornithine carbamoyltransferase [Alphaproteobacteria bacterium]
MRNSFKHFLNLSDLKTKDLNVILEESHRIKKGKGKKFKKKKILAMIFEKPSTRTRVSFEVGMKLLNGDVVILDTNESQIGRGESLEDTMRVLSRYVDIVVYRGASEDKLYNLADLSTVPLINGLTDRSHPCQILADIMTLQEKFKSIEKLKICWIGDGNNVCNSWIHSCDHFGYEFNISCPPGNFPSENIIGQIKSKKVKFFKKPSEAVVGADVVITDTWVSMGMVNDPKRIKKFKNFQINNELIKKSKKNTFFLHCLPAHRGCEVTDEVIDGKSSLVWDEAENRLYAHQALLLWCLKEI